MELLLYLVPVILLFLSWGSFLNVVAYRLAFEKPFFTKRSYCPACEKKIFWYDNLPFMSWFLLKGKCRQCKQPISVIYPVIEGLTLVVMLGLFVSVIMPSIEAAFLLNVTCGSVSGTAKKYRQLTWAFILPETGTKSLLKAKLFCWYHHCFLVRQPFPAGIDTDKPV